MGKGWQVAQQIENNLGPMALAALNPAIAGIYGIGRGLEAGKAGPAVNAALSLGLGPAQSLAAAFGRNALANYVDDPNVGRAAVNSALGIGKGYATGLGAQLGYDIAGLNGIDAGRGLAGLGYNAAVGGIASGLAGGLGGAGSVGGSGASEGGDNTSVADAGGMPDSSISGMVAATLGLSSGTPSAGTPLYSSPLLANGGQQVNAMFDGAMPLLDIPDYMPMTQPNARPVQIGSSYAQPRQLADLLRNYYAG